MAGVILVSAYSSQVNQDNIGSSRVQDCQFLGNLGILQNLVSEIQEAKIAFGKTKGQKVLRRISIKSFQPQFIF